MMQKSEKALQDSSEMEEHILQGSQYDAHPIDLDCGRV